MCDQLHEGDRVSVLYVGHKGTQYTKDGTVLNVEPGWVDVDLDEDGEDQVMHCQVTKMED